MQTLRINPAIPYAVPEIKKIVLIGCGVTGSHIAQSLVRLTYQRTIPITLIDHDLVEQKNVGRQLFTAQDVGKQKAQVLAARFSALFGTVIRAWSEPATHKTLVAARARDGMTLYIGAVDNAAARREIAAAQLPGQTVWLDAGNHQHAGQVALGTATSRNEMHGCLRLDNLCSMLPAPSLVYPDLLQDEERPAPACAEAMDANLQSLMVNQMIAAIAAEYIYKLLYLRRVTTFATEVDLTNLSMRSIPITKQTLHAYMEDVT